MHAYICTTKLTWYRTNVGRHCKIGNTCGCSVTDQDGADILQHALATERKLRDRNSQLAVPNKSFARVRAICEQQLQQMSGAAQRAAPSRLPGSAVKVSNIECTMLCSIFTLFTGCMESVCFIVLLESVQSFQHCCAPS